MQPSLDSVHVLLPRKLFLLTFLGIMGTHSVLPMHGTNFIQFMSHESGAVLYAGHTTVN